MTYPVRMATRVLATIAVFIITPAAALNPDLHNPYIMWAWGIVIFIEIAVSTIYDKETS